MQIHAYRPIPIIPPDAATAGCAIDIVDITYYYY